MNFMYPKNQKDNTAHQYCGYDALYLYGYQIC